MAGVVHFQKLKMYNPCQLYHRYSLFGRFLASPHLITTYYHGDTNGNNGSNVQFLELEGNRRLAYTKLNGKRSPSIIYVAGFNSTMNDTKAKLLNSFCMENDYPFLRFDYESVGESSGSYNNVHIGLWKENLLALIDKLTDGPQLIIGYSLGFWVTILAAIERMERIHSLIGISATYNNTDYFYSSLPRETRNKIDVGQDVPFTSYFGTFVFTQQFFNNCRQSHIPTDRSLALKCPISLLHSIPDNVSHYKSSILLAKLVQSDQVNITLRKNSDHQMLDDSFWTLLQSVVQRHVTLH